MLLLVGMVFWIGREPAALNPLVLLKQLHNAPETGKPDYPDHSGENDVADEGREAEKDQTGRQEEGPAAIGKEIFTLDYDRMKQTDAQK